MFNKNTWIPFDEEILVEAAGNYVPRLRTTSNMVFLLNDYYLRDNGTSYTIIARGYPETLSICSCELYWHNAILDSIDTNSIASYMQNNQATSFIAEKVVYQF